MYSIENYSTGVQGVLATTTPGGVSETELEQTIGVSLLADYNQQLADIAQTMQENLDTKQEVSAEIADLQTIDGRESTEINGESYIELSADETANLAENYPDLVITEQDGVSYVSKNSLEAEISSKQEDLSGLNSTSELLSLQIQSLVDQRKNAITMLSNLIASRDDTLMSIVRNIKVG